MSTSGWPTNAAPSAAVGPVHDVEDARRQHRGHGGGDQQHRAGARRRRLDHHGVPASRAGRTLLAMTETGQLKGRTAATTPCGTHSMRVAPPPRSRGASASATSGAKADAMPAMVAVSKIASRCVLPCSRVRSRARSQLLDRRHAGLGRGDDPRRRARPAPGRPSPAAPGGRRPRPGRAAPGTWRGHGARPRTGGRGWSPDSVPASPATTSPSTSRPTPVTTSSTCVVMCTPGPDDFADDSVTFSWEPSRQAPRRDGPPCCPIPSRGPSGSP